MERYVVNTIRSSTCYCNGKSLFILVIISSRILRHQIMSIEIISSSITIQIQNLSLHEGQRKLLTSDMFTVPYADLLAGSLRYMCIKEAMHGRLVDAATETKVMRFNDTQLKMNTIYYEHDGTETLEDDLVLVLQSDQVYVQSQPSTLHVEVIFYV